MQGVRTCDSESTSSMRSIYEAHFGYVWTNLRVLGVPDVELPDATQEVFLVLHLRYRELDLDRPLRPWLFGVCRRIALRGRRRRARDERRTLTPQTGLPEGSDSWVEWSNASKILLEFLAGLNPHQREVFVLAELHEMTAREMADTLGISPNTASSRLRLARAGFDRHMARVRSQDHREALSRESVTKAHRTLAPSEEQQKRSWQRLAGALVSRVARPLTSVPMGFGLTTLLAGAIVAGIVVAVHQPRPSHGPSAPATASTPIIAVVPPGETAQPTLEFIPERIEHPPPRTEPSRRKSRPQPPSSRATPEPSQASDELAAENRMIAEAKRALASGRAEDALWWSRRHGSRFPHGAFRVEALQLEVTSLCKLGRSEDARQHLGRFASLDADSAMGRVLDACPSLSGENHESEDVD